MNVNQPYLALDLELNNAQDNSTPNPKIIQIGVAIGSFTEFQNDALITRKWYVDPGEPIFEFITQLTGITNHDIAHKALPHDQIARELGELIKDHHCFVNPVVWGGGDTVELKNEFKERHIAFPYFGRRWIDVKTWHTLNVLANGKKPNLGLASALTAYKLQFKGLQHRADDDALNTLRLFFTILSRQQAIHQLIASAKTIH